jgi:hypothetical protein
MNQIKELNYTNNISNHFHLNYQSIRYLIVFNWLDIIFHLEVMYLRMLIYHNLNLHLSLTFNEDFIF